MARVLIVSRTNMSGGNVCVGGLIAQGAKNVRLLTSLGANQPSTAPFQVGEFWDMALTSRPRCIPPHVEDMLVQSATNIGISNNIVKDINAVAPVYQGALSETFQGTLLTPRGRAWHIERSNIPSSSVCFWKTPVALSLEAPFGKPKYHYNTPQEETYLPFVGISAPQPIIPAGTLVRLSLARWWTPEGQQDEHCYLQLSGWY